MVLLRKIRRLLTSTQGPEIEDGREGRHALIEGLHAKGFLQGTARLGAAVLAATVFLRAADTNAASNALAVPMAGIRSV